MPAWIVAPAVPDPAGALDPEGWFQKFVRDDAPKGFFSREDMAIREAEAQAAKHPGVMYAVYTIGQIVETTTPTYRRKMVNERGEIVLKPEVSE